MGESFSDSVSVSGGIALESDSKIWLGGMFSCISNVINRIGRPENPEPDLPWEIPYEELEQLEYLGSGAQGVVYSGKMYGELVAMKKLRDKGETNIKHLRKLNHENIVRFRGVCTEPSFYVIMEYCQYGSLYDFIRSGTVLLPGQVMKWAKDIAVGMAYLHAHKIIHRDLKSANVLIADNLTVKVSDFGTSRVWENVSMIMSFTGTVAWMAPEVIRHERCSEKVDVWSFGVVLWELLTRLIPFKGFDSHAVMWGVGTDSIALPIPSGCPSSMQVLLCQCWQRIPRNRPSFKIIAAHLEMATPDIVAVDPDTFSKRQAEWGAEVQEKMETIFAKKNKDMSPSSSEQSQVEETPTPREDLRQVKLVYEQQMNRANQLFMEVCAVRLQLEQREKELEEREKLLKACRCSQRKNKIHRQQSSTSSDSKPAICKKLKNKEPAQMLVNYIDKDEGSTYTMAVTGCMCNQRNKNNNIESPTKKIVIKDTVVEKNGNVEIGVHKPKKDLDNAKPDIVQV